MAGARGKCPPKETLIDLAYEFHGDYTELAQYCNVHVDTVRNWVKRLGIQKAILDARHPVSVTARGVIRRKIQEGHLQAAQWWVERDDKLTIGLAGAPPRPVEP